MNDVWPARDRDVLFEYVTKTPREIFEIDQRCVVNEAMLTPRDRFLLKEPLLLLQHNAVHGNALLRVWEDRRAFTDPVMWSKYEQESMSVLGFVPNASLITSRGLKSERALRTVKLRRQAIDFENAIAVSEGRGAVRSDVLIETRLMDGAALGIPTTAESGSRGLIFHFHSLHGNPGERAVLKKWQERGWTIVHFQTDARVATPIADDKKNEIADIDSQMDALHTDMRTSNDVDSLYKRWTSLARNSSELLAGAFVAQCDDDAASVGRTIAHLTDDAIASSAYGAEAVYIYLKTHRPELLRGPLVLSGFSAGSLVTPAVAVRLMELPEPPKIDAIVLVGSGADLFALSRDSSLTDGGVTIRVGTREPTREFLDRVHDSYRSRVKLDSLVTATALHGLDVLQVHASRDGWVPAHCGELLYERLGRPDKLTVYTGHVGLFFRLGWYDDFLADWIDDHTDRPK